MRKDDSKPAAASQHEVRSSRLQPRSSPCITYRQEVVRLSTLQQLSAQARGLANLVRGPEMLNFVYCLSLVCSLKLGGEIIRILSLGSLLIMT